jgi:signal peptidase II
VAAVGVAADQLTKWWAVNALTPGDADPPSILDGLVSLRLTFNSGAAFSMGSKATVLFASFSMLMAIALVAYVLVRPIRSWAEAMMAGGLFAGICGNLLDRLFRAPGPMRGYVVDFIAVDYFAIFNVADAFITCSVVAFVIWQWRADRTGAASAPEGIADR